MAKTRKIRRTYYWLVGYKSDNTPLITYGGETESEARSEGFRCFQATTYDVVPLPTSNQAEATSMIKRLNLIKTGNPDEAMRRTSHIPEKRERIEYY